MASQNWHTHFVNRPGNKKGNKDTTVYSTAWGQTTANNARLALLTNDPSMAVLAVDASSKIIFVHSFKNLGGTILKPTNRFAGFIRNGRVALAVITDDSSLLAHINILMPPYASIIVFLDKAETEGLAHPTANAAPTFHGIVSFLPAPWLLEVVSYANIKDPALIILAASKFDAKFDNEHKNDHEYVTSTKDQLEEFIKLTWGVQAGNIPRLNYSIEPGNKALLFYHQERHQNLIASIPPPPFAATTLAKRIHPPIGTAPNTFNLLGTSTF